MYAIRAECEDVRDVDAIGAVHRASFETETEARLVGLLRDAERLSVSLVAEVQDRVGLRVVGHIAFSPVTMDSGTGSRGAGLAPVAVLEAFRRRGIGGELIRAGLHACAEAGFGWVVVLGDPGYYTRFGFRPAASTFGLRDVYTDGAEPFQAMELRPGAIPSAGTIHYAPEFAQAGC